jgi:hypothetical protein
MAKKIIGAGAPPIVWSTVDQAFSDINANFTELYSSIGGGGGVVDFSDLPTSLVPRNNEVYDVGSPSNRWRVAYFSSDGISIGGSNIEDINGTISLPSGSTVGGQLIKDPAEVAFGSVVVSGQPSVVANSATSVLNLAGSGIGITTNSTTDTVTFTNNGVRTLTAGAGISLAGTANDPVINAAVGGVASGLGIGVTQTSGTYTVVNQGIVGLEAGLGINIGARDPVTGRVVITNQSPASGILSFRTITAPAGSNVVAQTTADTLNLTAGDGISILNNSGSSTINFTNTGVTSLTSTSPNVSLNQSTGAITLSFNNRIDIIGSVFADDSTMLVDGTNGKIVGPIQSSNGASVITMGDFSSGGVVIGGTAGASVVGAATAPVYIGAGPSGGSSGTVTIGHGSNSVIVNGTLTATLSGNVTGNLTGTSTGFHDGDMSGSVFADNSTMLVDGTGGRIVGPVESSSIAASAYIQTAVYGNITAVNISIVEPAKGMIVFNNDTSKFIGWNGLAWVELG